MAADWEAFIQREKDEEKIDIYLRQVVIEQALGIQDITESEIAKVRAWAYSGKTVIDLSYIFADLVSRRALIGVSHHFVFFIFFLFTN